MSGGTHLELEERERLAALEAEGLSLRAIARALGRAASTISRELRRNALPRGGYLPVHAEGVAGLRDLPRAGRHSRLSEGQQAALKALVLRGPDLERDGCIAWRARGSVRSRATAPGR